MAADFDRIRGDPTKQRSKSNDRHGGERPLQPSHAKGGGEWLPSLREREASRTHANRGSDRHLLCGEGETRPRWRGAASGCQEHEREHNPRGSGDGIASRRGVIGTALFRPIDNTSGSFLPARPEATTRELAQQQGLSEVRVSGQRSIIAAGATTAECLTALLATPSSCRMDVRTRPPAKKTRSTSFIYGGNPDLEIPAILEALESSPGRVSEGYRHVTCSSCSSRAHCPSVCRCTTCTWPCRRCGQFDHTTASRTPGQ